jgi:hypothetical protein
VTKASHVNLTPIHPPSTRHPRKNSTALLSSSTISPFLSLSDTENGVHFAYGHAYGPGHGHTRVSEKRQITTIGGTHKRLSSLPENMAYPSYDRNPIQMELDQFVKDSLENLNLREDPYPPRKESREQNRVRSPGEKPERVDAQSPVGSQRLEPLRRAAS